MTTNGTQDTPSYKSPPINEVVCGCQFQPLERLKLHHIGTLWEQFKGEFPTVEHLLPFPREDGGLPIDSSTGFPWPRVWFINIIEDRLIQFQPDRFYFNWRKRNEKTEYPRFEKIVGEFVHNFSVLEKFVADVGLGIIQPISWELNYINHIPVGEGWNAPQDFSKVFRDFCWQQNSERFLPHPKNLAWQAIFEIPEEKGELIAKLSHGKRKSDDTHLLILELAARGVGKDASSASRDEWFNLAHTWIVKSFADLTTTEIQEKIWKRES